MTELLNEQWAQDLAIRIEVSRRLMDVARAEPDLTPQQLVSAKVPLGAFTAVTGMLLLGGDFVPGFSALDSQRQILAYALTFGYAQQLVSRLIDHRARDIVSRLPSAQHIVEAKAN